MKYCNILCRNTCRGSKLHLNFMPFKYSSIYCKAQREREREMEGKWESCSDRQGEKEVHIRMSITCRFVQTLRAGHLCAQMEHFTRETHPPASSLTPPPSQSTHAHTCTYISLSKTHIFITMICLLQIVSAGDGGKGQIQNSGGKHSFTTARLSGFSASALFVCHFFWGGGRPAQCRVLSALNGVNSCWCGRETDLNLLLPVFKVQIKYLSLQSSQIDLKDVKSDDRK